MKSKRAMEYFSTQTPNQANLEYCAKNKRYNGTVLADAYKAIAIAEQDAEERADKRILEMQKLFVEVMKKKFGYIIALEVSNEVSQIIKQNGGQSDE